MANRAFNPVLYNVLEGRNVGAVSHNLVFGTSTPRESYKYRLWVKADFSQALGNVEVGTAEVLDRHGAIARLSSSTEIQFNAVAVGSKIYSFSGSNVMVYDPSSGKTSTLDVTLPVATTQMAAVSIGTRVYLFGGNRSGSQTADVLIFNTETNTFTRLSNVLPRKVEQCSAAAVGTKVYLFGGTNSSSGRLSNIIIFNTETNTATDAEATIPPVPYPSSSGSYTGLYASTAAAIGTKVYIFGGIAHPNGTNRILMYDTETDKIVTLGTSFPSNTYLSCESGQQAKGLCDIAVGVIDQKIYLFGGTAGYDNYNAVSVFDPENNTLTVLDVTFLQGGSGSAAVVDGIAYVFFGKNGMSCFTNGSLNKGHLYIKTTTTKNFVTLTFNALSFYTTGIEAVYIGNENNQAEKVSAYLYDFTAKAWKLIT